MSEAESGTESVFARIKRRHRGAFDSLGRGWERFRQHRMGVVGLTLFVAIVAMAVLAPVLAPHGVGWQAPETSEYSFDDEGNIVTEGVIHPAGPALGGLTGDDYVAPLGTTADRHGVLTQLIFGSRIALYIGLTAGLLSSLVGVPLGLVSGYYGDTWVDESIQRLIDVMYGLPFLPLVIVLVAVNGINTTNIIIAIALKSWTNNALVIRGETLSLKERTYVEAAKVSGASDTRVVFRHILPNVLPLGFVYLAQDAAFAILTQANLAFLGLADSTVVSWGTMLQQIQLAGEVYSAPWWLLPPGIMITLLAASFYFVGYSLEDVMNPHTD
ncbi:MAG: ABC transporter permease [Halobacteriaceae archaeon]